MCRNRRGIKRSGHHHNAQITPPLLQLKQQRKREVAFQVSLMEFIKDHRAHTLEPWVAHEPAVQHTLGHIAQPCARACEVFKPHLVANAVAHALTTLTGHAPRRESCRKASRLKHNHFAIEAIHQVCGHPRGLARARRRLNHKVPVKRQSGKEVINR